MLSITKFIPGMVGACLMFMGQVGPDDAEKNICKWVRLLWEKAPEQCIPVVSSDWISLISIALISVTIALVITPFVLRNHKRSKAVFTNRSKIPNNFYFHEDHTASTDYENKNVLASIVVLYNSSDGSVSIGDEIGIKSAIIERDDDGLMVMPTKQKITIITKEFIKNAKITSSKTSKQNGVKYSIKALSLNTFVIHATRESFLSYPKDHSVSFFFNGG